MGIVGATPARARARDLGVIALGTGLSQLPVPPSPTGPAGTVGSYVGKQRNILVCILLEIVTIGIYGCYWVWHAQEDVKRRSSQGAGGWLGLVIYLVIGLVTIFLIPYEVKQMYDAEGDTSPVSGWTGLWNLIPLIGQIVWFVKVQGALNRFWASRA